MAHGAKATLVDIPSINNCVGLPLELIKAKPNLLTQLLSPNDGYLQTVKAVYHYRKQNKRTEAATSDGHVVDPLTLILDIDKTLIYTFKWFDILEIGEEIEYDEEKAIITEIHYMVRTQSLTQTTKHQSDHYVANITNMDQTIPRIGSYINGKFIIEVNVHQIVIEIINSFMHMKSMTIQTSIESERYEISQTTTDGDMETPQPTPSIIININDDTEMVKKIAKHQLFDDFKDEVIKIGDQYIAIRPDLDEFLFLCVQLFDDIKLCTKRKKHQMNDVLNGLHDYLKNKLTKYNKRYKKQQLWNDILYRDICDDPKESVIKNVAEFGVDLSRIIIVDSDDVCFVGLEPNRIKMNGYIPNNNDNELIDIVWPILFESHKYNDVRYGLLRKPKNRNTMPICSESESLAQTMRYLVVLQYTYFKSQQILQQSNEYGGSADYSVIYNENKSIYSTDSDQDTDYHDDSDETETESEDETDESEETKPIPSFSCYSVFADVSTFIEKLVSK